MAQHTPTLFIHPAWSGFIVDLEPLSWSGFTTAALVAYPSLFSQLIRVGPQGLRQIQPHELPAEPYEEIIDAALAAWGTTEEES